MPLNLRELWEYKELLYFFVWRDLKVRYKQTALGVAWAILQPVMMVLVFTVFFGTLLKVPSGGVPYPVFSFTALLAWNLFARGLTDASTSLSGSRDLVTKVYFPRLLLPTADVLAALVDFGISFAVLIGLLIYYGITPTLAVVLLPGFLLIAVLAALGIGFWFSALDARYRDIRYLVPFIVQLWFFATPIVIPATIVPLEWRWLYSLNPMVGVVEGFRWALLGTAWTIDPTAWISIVAVVAIFIGGLYYFRRAERIFADVV